MNDLTPTFARQIEELRQAREADAAAREEARRAAVSRRAATTRQGSSPIERFNAANRIEDLLLKYGYEPSTSGLDWRSPLQQSGSFATRVYDEADGHEYWVSLSESDATGGLGAKAASGARHGDAFDLFVQFEHSGSMGAALAAWSQEETNRRKAQCEENAQIGAGPDAVPLSPSLSVNQMLDELVFIRDGSQVADVSNPYNVLSLADLRNALAGSKHHLPKDDGGTKVMPAIQFWLESRERKQADTLTFKAGAGLMTRCPNGRPALNLYRLRVRGEVPENWAALAARFVEHVRSLWGGDTEPFLDWLAHIEQKPGELPHFGWLHTSHRHGTGRNWVASVLTRLWPGNVAASLDLVGLLEGNFNDRLSRCLLAIVDEINEGGGKKHRTANRLRQLVTPEVREINPKYGRRRIEHNAARWLIFSNHTGALPLDENDRRFWVVSHDGEPRDARYFVELYAFLRDPGFIASVAEFLGQRDISGFNPGQRPPMNDAKAALVEFNQSEEDAACKMVTACWPVDLITASEMNARLPTFSGVTKPAVRYAMDRSGIKKLPNKVRYSGVPSTVYAVRNYDRWKTAPAGDVKAEIDRASEAEKTAAMKGESDD